MSHVAPAIASATQVVYPWRAAIRTGLQAFLAFALFLAVALPIVTPFLNDYLPEAWVGYVIAAAGFVSALAAVITRLLALPQLVAFLTAIGLGPVPNQS